MKIKTLVAIALSAVTVITTPVSAQTIDPIKDDIIYSTDYLNVRVDSSIDSKRVGVLKPNTQLLRIKAGKKWDKIEIDGKKYFVCNDYITEDVPDDKIIKINDLKDIPIPIYKEENSKKIYLGRYRLTAYCSCSRCCGSWGGRVTSSGTTPTVGRTVACNSIPAGTRVIINGHQYTVEDTGNMNNNVIDIYMASHAQALDFGVQYADVYLAE